MALTLALGPGAAAGLGRGPGPVDRPEEEEGERDGAALLLLALLRVLLEADRPGVASCSPAGRHALVCVVCGLLHNFGFQKRNQSSLLWSVGLRGFP